MASQNLNSVATATSITPASDYLIISKGGTAINKITAATALSNAFAGAAKNTSITATDQLMMATGGTTANRIDYNVLAKAIIENYASSSLAGKTQSVQGAFAALNSKTSWTNIPNESDLNNYTEIGIYYTASTSQTSSIINKPSDLTSAFSMIIARRGAFINQIIFDYGGAIYIRGQLSSGWHNWYKFTGTTIS